MCVDYGEGGASGDRSCPAEEFILQPQEEKRRRMAAVWKVEEDKTQHQEM